MLGKIYVYMYILIVCPNTKAICKNLYRNFLLELWFLLSGHTSSEEISFSFWTKIYYFNRNLIFCKGLFLAMKVREPFFARRGGGNKTKKTKININQW